MFLKKLIAILIGVVISFFLCEVILRIYNPFRSRVKGNEIILKSNYKKTVVIDPHINGLNDQIRFSTNSIGFRGPEPPSETDWGKALTILTIGGSTTECSLLDDDSTWSAHLYRKLHGSNPSVWLNNAGMDGCSTYGHIILMRDYVIKLKPDYAVFLVGINDLVKAKFDNEDGFLINRKESFWRSLFKKSELLTTISNVMDAMKSQKANVSHGSDPDDYKKLDFNTADSNYRRELNQKVSALLPAYVTRIATLDSLCRTAGIKPVFVTQPKYDDTASNSWKIMETYNQALRDYCKTREIHCIDLANLLPKDKKNYYDQIHFTNAGASLIGDIIYQDLKNYIK